MDRQQIIQNFSKNLESFRKLAFRRGLGQGEKGQPTRSQASVMFMVSGRSRTNVKEIAQAFGMTPSAVTQLVNGLVSEGMLARKADRKDRRVSCLELTAKGKRVVEQLKKKRLQNFSRIFEPLTDSEMQQFDKIQQKIIDHAKTV